MGRADAWNYLFPNPPWPCIIQEAQKHTNGCLATILNKHPENQSEVLMKNLNQLLALTGVALTLAFSGVGVMAQGGFGGGGFGGGGGGGGGGFDFNAILQQQAERMRPTLAVTNDDEWNVISPRLVKVMQLRAEVGLAGLANMGGGMMGGRGGGGGMRGFAALFGTADPAADALTKALGDNAPIAEVKAAMAKVREARKRKQAEMAKAQADLQAVVSIRQEAILLNDGLLE
jgi:hypothetical protein